MDPASLPYFDACAGTAVTSAACGAAMAPVCASGSSDASGNLRSLLLDPASNCSRWVQAVQVGAVVARSLTAGAPFVDDAMAAYCAGDGATAPECACLTFPRRAAPWCAGAAADCPSLPASACPAREFAQVGEDGASLDVIQFTSCNPYYCWLAACYESPSDMLITSDIAAATAAPNVCAAVCGIELSGTSNITLGPMPPGSFGVLSVTADISILQSCGAQTAPAMLTAMPQAWSLPVNATLQVPFVVTNQGDFPAQVTVSSATDPALAGVCALEPTETLVWGRSAQTFLLTCDEPTVAAWYAASASANGGSLTIAPAFTLTYPDLAGGGAAKTVGPMGATLTFTTAMTPVTVVVDAAPTWFWLVVGLSAALVAALVVWTWRAGARVADGVARLSHLAPAPALAPAPPPAPAP